MNATDSLRVVVEAVNAVTDSFGSPKDQAQVIAFLKAPDVASIEVFFYVGGIPLRNFFAFSTQAFDSSKASLWQEIQKRSGKSNLPEPSQWGADTRLSQLSGIVQIFA